jgi:pimeloyl-ACP methyl ester carboxylesterase
MSTFALVHGAWHGAWCWEKLSPELESLGHRVIAMDLPCDDGSATFDDYAEVVCAAITDNPGDDVILVGHSLGGQTTARVAARRPVRHLVYLCAVPPVVGRSLAQELADDTEMLNSDYLNGIGNLDAERRRSWVDREVATRVLFGDCDDATAAAAFARLRPQGTDAYGAPYPLAALPSVESTYVMCTEDRLVNPDWSRQVACTRLGADLVELPGSHSPFLSRPRELAQVLNGLR